MGLARRFERGSDHGLTQTGMTLGTFDYISPEQARDPRDVDVRSDLYSLGCTLFHMLTGRPPFPGGTMMQKLIQHREEPPADVRTMNREVPAELASVITKLMAKDRDRRYQSPEQLVRDLLKIAGVVGLNRTPSELDYWIALGHRPTWERHLVWMLPALGFLVVISGLVWWGYEFSKPSPSESRRGTSVASRQAKGLDLAGSTEGPEFRLTPESSAPENEPLSPASSYPRTIPVNSNEDLLTVLASAPRRSVIVLSDDGPYALGGRARSGRAPVALTNADLTIKAEAGVRPRLKFADDSRRTDPLLNGMLHFVGGHITLEGLEFETDPVLNDETATAIRAEDTELVLRGCSFRRLSSSDREAGTVSAVRVRAGSPRTLVGDRPPILFADSCHFDGGQVAVIADGPSDVVLRDCTLGPARSSIWFDNSRSTAPVAGELRLIHTSILAGDGPVFRFEGSLIRAWLDDTVIAPAGRSPATLVMIDEPRNLIWHGRSNVFSQIGTYLTSFGGKGQTSSSITEFSGWEQSPTDFREVGSRVSGASVWDAADPMKALSQERENPTRASSSSIHDSPRHRTPGLVTGLSVPSSRTSGSRNRPAPRRRRSFRHPRDGRPSRSPRPNPPESPRSRAPRSRTPIDRRRQTPPRSRPTPGPRSLRWIR